jgi:two-component system chemotaxis sensor kinase CheA
MSEQTQRRFPARNGLRSRLIRAMVTTLVVVSGATLITVGYINYRTARHTLETIETHIRQSIVRKGQGLATNHALALRSLAADNAFGDIGRLVERSVRQDDDMLYGLFLGADGRPWAFVVPTTGGADLGAKPDLATLGIDPQAGRQPGAEARQRSVFGHEAFEFSSSVDADDGAVLGRIFYGLSSVPLERALSAARRDFQRTLLLTLLLLVVLGIAASLLGMAIIRGVSARITRPLGHLTEVATAIADGRKDRRVSIGSQDEIGVLGSAFNQMLEELDDSYRRLEALNRNLEHRVEERTRELGQRNRDMRLVLDNVNQGFLTMSRPGVLAQERSAIVDQWFGASAPGESFVSYVERRNRAFAESFQLGYDALLEGILPLQLCLEQLPHRLRDSDREFAFSYKAIVDQTAGDQIQGLLIVINDITEQVMHARQESDRSELLAMIQGFMRDRSGFLAFFDEASHLLDGLEQDADEVTRKRLLHTLKGNAALAGLQVVTELCHRAEEQLAEGNDADARGTLAALRDRWRTLGDTLATLLGERGRDVVEIPAGELDGALEELRAAGTPARATARLAAWKLEPTERSLARLGRYARSLSQRLGKGDLQVAIDGGGVRLDPQRWTGLWSEVVHVVRNAVDHGLETPDERRAAGKAATPRLALRTAATADDLSIDIEDDGRGIDWEAIRRAGRDKGLPCATDADLTAVLLAPDVTTRERVTVTSGRGMGLASVAERVRALGGAITVTSRSGQGTQFRLVLPLRAPAAAKPDPMFPPAGNGAQARSTESMEKTT